MSQTLIDMPPLSSPLDSTIAVNKVSHWHAFLQLDLAVTKRGVVLKNSQHQGPLYIQKPFYPEGRDLAHLYLLHPPGGLVSGDHLALSCTQHAGANTLLTTPGAGRVYKARADRSLQSQTNHFIVNENASLEWLPQETILYPEANTRLMTHVDLAQGAQFIGWEITCFGLPASNLFFDKGQINQTLEIRQQGRIKLRERMLINADNLPLLQQTAGFNQQTINGLMVAGPCLNSQEDTQSIQLEKLIEQLQECCEDINHDKCPAMASVSLTGQFLLIRYLGASSEQAKILFLACWQKIRPFLLNRDACIPRIWAT